jgi:hypothetical protein
MHKQRKGVIKWLLKIYSDPNSNKNNTAQILQSALTAQSGGK